MWYPPQARSGLVAAVALTLAACASGCVERMLQIRSEPNGAAVYVNGELAGTTPLDHRFDFYGTFAITLRSGSQLSLHQLEAIRPPWYEIPPLDFFAENIVPWKIRDHRLLSYRLEEARPRDDDEAGRLRKAMLERLQALEAEADRP